METHSRPHSHVHVPPGQPRPSELPARALRRAIFFACFFLLRASFLLDAAPDCGPLPGTPLLGVTAAYGQIFGSWAVLDAFFFFFFFFPI